MDALSGDEELGPLLEAVRVTEGHFGQGSSTAGVMDDILREERRGDDHHTLHTLTNNNLLIQTEVGVSGLTFTIPLM